MSFIDVIIGWLRTFWGYVLDALSWSLDGLLLIIEFSFYSTFDGLFLVIETFFNLLDLSAIAFSYSATWSSLPPQTIWVINQINLPQGLALLAGAYILRLTLNLIPTWATRV